MSNREENNKNHPAKEQKGPVQFQVEKQTLTRAVLLVPDGSKIPKQSKLSQSQYSLSQRIDEIHGLASAIDLDVRAIIDVPLVSIKPATYFGSGKVEELESLISINKAELVIVDHNLSPVQQRNLERQWQIKVLDRTNLILEIFGRRAVTKEGRLQVELAHLNYQKSRLVRSWTHLERQRGGKGFLGGPGETQIESDRRQLQSRIVRLSKDLEKVRKTRELHRKKRRQIPFPVIVLVGYTNAGKSTLFNLLTGANVVAKDKLFATLDPTMRAITLPSGNQVILSDTVGFISNLPTQLIEAFKATLEEVLEADLILHVQDVSNQCQQQQREDVIKILEELGVNNSKKTVPVFEIWNKSDNISEQTLLNQLLNQAQQTEDKNIHLVSSKTGEGIELLLKALDQELANQELNFTLMLDTNQGAIINWLYKNGRILNLESNEQGKTEYQVALPKRLAGKLQKILKENQRVEEKINY